MRVGDNGSPDFDISDAVAEITDCFRAILERMRAKGLKAFIFTGTFFEPDDGAFSPYGLSKALTAQAIRRWRTRYNSPLGKFVISNPFVPLGEPCFSPV